MATKPGSRVQEEFDQRYCIKTDEYEAIYPGRFTNTDPYGAAVIVAVTNAFGEWTAYWGAGPSESETECYLIVARHGNKMSYKDAIHFFPDIDKLFRWRA